MVGDQDFWSNADRAQSIMRERNAIENGISEISHFQGALADNVDLIELSEQEGDEELLDDVQTALEEVREQAIKAELKTLLSGEADKNDCYLEIHAGAGGTEAQDWAEMLIRMYARWSESHGHKVEWMQENSGEEAGIKSATLKIIGDSVYGWLKAESGIHRLVRISPYDSNARRHTSFASVGVFPVIDDNIEVDIEDKDLRIDTYRSSGAGGQHVNTTDSAIRITHQPTGIVVQCQSDRSQHKNRATALAMLRARLYERELKIRETQAQANHAAKSEIGWGHQIRSYVLQPYQMVKDLRTNVETSDTQGVLDGAIDEFLSSALANGVNKANESKTS